MPVIKARPDDEKALVKVSLRLTQRHARLLNEYAAFINETENPSYVVTQLIQTVLAKDKDFVARHKKTDGAASRQPTLSDVATARTA